MKWSSAIYAAPRSDFLLESTLDSIRNAGWDPTIYAEPNTTTLPCVERPKIYGAWVNWLVALFEMYQSNIDAEYFIIFENDIKICKNTRQYIEESIPLLGDFAYISLYTPSHLDKNGPRIYHNESLGLWTYGTQAILMSRKKLCSFLLNERTFKHHENSIYFFGQKKDDTGNDLLLGMWANDINLPVYYHSPSLVQHCGVSSTQGSGSHQSLNFLGEDFDAMTLNTIDPIVLKNKTILL